MSQRGLYIIEEESATCTAKEKEALSVMCLLKKKAQIIHIKCCGTNKEVWENSSSLCENKVIANRLHLIEEVMTSKMAPESKSQEHIEKIRGLLGN